MQVSNKVLNRTFESLSLLVEFKMIIFLYLRVTLKDHSFQHLPNIPLIFSNLQCLIDNFFNPTTHIPPYFGIFFFYFFPFPLSLYFLSSLTYFLQRLPLSPPFLSHL